MKHVRSVLLAALAAPVLLTACGSDDDSTAGAPAPNPASATTAPSSVPPPESSAPATAAAGGATTAPGTELKLGERAVVPFEYGNSKSGTIAITVTAIERGDNADLAAFGDRAKGLTPFYVRATIENVGGTDLSYSSVSLRGLGADGRSTGVIISGDTDKCESESAGKDFTTAGAKYQTCVLTAAREGGSVTAAEFDKGDAYSGSPLVWKS
ncbi:hypothetical protein GCM10017786_02980 [Amycolatopsis deserti]|uniref:Lipoprotein n=1 Tax=Amycolatopsis deserti TaxID=185696 RepID=A0ABQ3IDS8_9PSEU|nr:hypothetical protein [Amycolatopsis deserti]GHE77088.1 hypothetical protein GCM10017786_02980 [Amycolatopsis deserti]